MRGKKKIPKGYATASDTFHRREAVCFIFLAIAIFDADRDNVSPGEPVNFEGGQGEPV